MPISPRAWRISISNLHPLQRCPCRGWGGRHIMRVVMLLTCWLSLTVGMLRDGPGATLAAMSLLQEHSAEFIGAGNLLNLDNKVVVGPSSVCDGRGLFANAALPARTLVSLYPVHAVGSDDHNSGQADLVASSADMDYFDASDARCEYRVYLRQSTGCINDFIDANPERPIIDGWVAHLVNDACMCEGREPAQVESYLERSVGAASCALVPVGRAPLMACVTTRPVAAGAELFVSYGPSYWVGGRPVAEAVPPSESSEQQRPTGGEQQPPPRRSGSDVLDATYWGDRGGARTVALLERSAAAVQSAEAVRLHLTSELAALDEGLELALGCVRDLQRASREVQQDEEVMESEASSEVPADDDARVLASQNA